MVLRQGDREDQETAVKIEYSPDVVLKCAQCGKKELCISRIFGLYCMACGWYRNKQSGMLRGRR